MTPPYSSVVSRSPLGRGVLAFGYPTVRGSPAAQLPVTPICRRARPDGPKKGRRQFFASATTTASRPNGYG